MASFLDGTVCSFSSFGSLRIHRPSTSGFGISICSLRGGSEMRWKEWLILIVLGIGVAYVVVASNPSPKELTLYAIVALIGLAVGLIPGIWHWWEHRREKNG